MDWPNNAGARPPTTIRVRPPEDPLMKEIEDQEVGALPVWAAFGDLMAGALGALALVLIGVLGLQMDLSEQLGRADQRQAEQSERLQTLEESVGQALAAPLAAGRVTLSEGRIGISGSLLFAFNSDELQPEGRALLKELVGPLSGYVRERGEVLMVSGFTDDRPVRDGSGRFADNWELSARRALTVTRALVEEGVAAADVFAAAFGSQQAVASNEDAAGRALNRRVEIVPMARTGPSRPASPG